MNVSSSNLEAVRYDSATKQLEIEFDSGDIYRYVDVPHALYEGLLDPPGGSHGEYFWDHIRNDFRYEKQ